MSLVRILIDGYSLLHAWPELAPGAARHSALARNALISVMTAYHDAAGTPISIFFDGQGAPPGTPHPEPSHGVEVLYSRRGQTADQMIERVTVRLLPYGQVLAVTNDFAERDVVVGFGGVSSSCASFITEVESVLTELSRDIKRHNRVEVEKFRRNK